MSGKKKFFLVFVFIVLDAFLLIVFLELRDISQKNRLKNEMNQLAELDFSVDRYSLKVKTRGECAIVERAIKEYLDSIAVLLQETLSIAEDPEFIQLLSYQNYMEDGPEFQKSFLYLKESKELFNHNMDDLLSKLDEKNIKDYIRVKTKRTYLWNLYEELILNDSMRGYFQETYGLLEKNKVRMNEMLDTSHALLTFLVSNKDSWVLEEGEIRFQTESLYQQYMNYIMIINK